MNLSEIEDHSLENFTYVTFSLIPDLKILFVALGTFISAVCFMCLGRQKMVLMDNISSVLCTETFSS
jgi:hypothetical protein